SANALQAGRRNFRAASACIVSSSVQSRNGFSYAPASNSAALNLLLTELSFNESLTCTINEARAIKSFAARRVGRHYITCEDAEWQRKRARRDESCTTR